MSRCIQCWKEGEPIDIQENIFHFYFFGVSGKNNYLLLIMEWIRDLQYEKTTDLQYFAVLLYLIVMSMHAPWNT